MVYLQKQRPSARAKTGKEQRVQRAKVEKAYAFSLVLVSTKDALLARSGKTSAKGKRGRPLYGAAVRFRCGGILPECPGV